MANVVIQCPNCDMDHVWGSGECWKTLTPVASRRIGERMLYTNNCKNCRAIVVITIVGPESQAVYTPYIEPIPQEKETAHADKT